MRSGEPNDNAWIMICSGGDGIKIGLFSRYTCSLDDGDGLDQQGSERDMFEVLKIDRYFCMVVVKWGGHRTRVVRC